MRNAVPTAPGKQTLGSAPSLPWGTLRTPRVLIIQTVGTLLCAYVFSGYVSGCFEVLFYGLAALGAPLTAGMHQALQVLCGHLAWVVMALRILGTRLEAFLPAPFGRGEREDEARWLTARWRVSWLTWVLGGYFASLLAYNLIEPLNQMILPPPPPGLTPLDAGPPNGLGPGADPDGGRSVVFRLLHPEHADRLALAVGALAPCLSAPVFEELLYRGFLLPALTRFMPLRLALPLHALLFGLHHHALPSLLPLTALGLVWGVLYVQSANLLVPVLVHGMWNSRIFISTALNG